ncbi:hypothetical protein [Lachnotalea glycerini]|uniref:Uncharacterized protein n=1 Tax=Lachnotalea glycerini TaxID=1763509 RepID=A0A371JKF2_9FIRM|nr:hypothetical protein [Lachnotalea glycerini]RDY33214.1 hypothetical protein CG710_001440 [Lachnotalea glycerini]
MKYIKIIVYAIISVVFSYWLFDKSTLAMVFIFYALNGVKLVSKSDFTAHKRTKRYGVVLMVCICGTVLIVLGKKIFNNDILIILGALMFAPTFTAIIIREIIALSSYLKCLWEKK